MKGLIVFVMLILVNVGVLSLVSVFSESGTAAPGYSKEAVTVQFRPEHKQVELPRVEGLKIALDSITKMISYLIAGSVGVLGFSIALLREESAGSGKLLLQLSCLACLSSLAGGFFAFGYLPNIASSASFDFQREIGYVMFYQIGMLVLSVGLLFVQLSKGKS